jgi:protein involved in polysaccharide export with SLBB domain
VWKRCSLVLTLLFLAAIATSAPAAPQNTVSPRETPPPASGDYLLGPGDKLKMVTYGEDALSGEFLVSDGGEVAVPLVGNVRAAGLSIDGFQEHVRAALADGYLKDPRVAIEVEDYRPFYILGEVNKPGNYPFVAGLTVLNAVATASGFTYRANTHRVFIKGDTEAKEHAVTITAATRVQPGDTIRVGERYF